MIQVRESPRVRRLRSDYKALERLRSESSILDFDTRASLADPPHEYHVRFLGRGIWHPPNSPDVAVRDSHDVMIRLGANYPRMMPELAWRSPIFHPNISSSGVVCLGGYGTFWAPSLNLDDLCVMLWDMIRYANYDVNSPYNREAALWVKTQTTIQFPCDPRPLRDRVAAQPAPVSEPSSRVMKPGWTAPPEIQFLGEVVEVEIVNAELVDDPATRNSAAINAPHFNPAPLRPARAEILIIE